MAYRLLHTIVQSATAAENYTKEYKEVWELDSIADFNPFMFSRKRKNSFIAEPSGGSLAYFIVESNSMTKRAPMAGGKVQVECVIRLRHFEDMDEVKAPWQLPVYNFRISGAYNEESTSQFWPENGDIWLERDDENPAPFVNTAGVMLEGTASYSTAQITFSYAISAVTFSLIQNWFWSLQGKINCDRVTICGMTFPERTVRIENMNAEYSEIELPAMSLQRSEIVDGNTVVNTYVVEPTNYHYYRVDVTLNANPRTWNQNFLNVGTHVNRNGVISRLWSWQDKTTGAMTFGTYGDYMTQQGVNGQPISEPVALNAAGTNASPIGADGRQIMTYRYGSLSEPISFQALAFPSDQPKKWSQGQ